MLYHYIMIIIHTLIFTVTLVTVYNNLFYAIKKFTLRRFINSKFIDLYFLLFPLLIRLVINLVIVLQGVSKILYLTILYIFFSMCFILCYDYVLIFFMIAEWFLPPINCFINRTQNKLTQIIKFNCSASININNYRKHQISDNIKIWEVDIRNYIKC